MPNYGYHLARAKGAILRRAYRSLLPAIVRSPLRVDRILPLDCYSYSGEAMLPEQVVSIRSLLRYAGRPKSFTVVSDGTYAEKSIAMLRAIDPSVQVANINDWIPSSTPKEIYRYLSSHPTGRQLALIMSLPVGGPALYVDSDVRFFASAHELSNLIQAKNEVPAYYLPDYQLSADERLFRSEEEKRDPVNTGFLLLFQKLDWSLSISRFIDLKNEPIFFTNQTMTHLTMHVNRAAPLDSDKYILRLDDQVILEDLYADASVALRHYVQPVRHKLWTSLFA
jgi:hypothetical protein